MEDSDQCKLFVGGISWETTEDLLREHFGRYGTVVGSVIAKDKYTGSPRGFAFVSFSDASAVDNALKVAAHNILGRTVEVKKAIPRSEQNHSQQEQSRGLNRNSRSNSRSNDYFRTKKIFVGGLSANLTEEEFKVHFEKFGRITDVVVMHDNMTHRPRGFGFITFDSEDAVEDVMQKSFHELSGKTVEVKRAVPKDVNGSSNSGYNARVGSGRGAYFNCYQPGNHPLYSPRYDFLPSYGAFPGYGGIPGYPHGASVYGGGYPTGGYGGIIYGPLAPRSPWSGPAMVGVRGSPLPYGSPATIYPTFMNGGLGLMGMAANGYTGIVGPAPTRKSSQVSGGNELVVVDVTPSQNDKNVDVGSLSSADSYGGESSKQNQRGTEGRFRPYSTTNMS